MRAFDYASLETQLRALSEGISYDITLLANASALLYGALENINWCGFYIFKDGALLLGPFQGKPACTRIEIGRGVCGTTARENRTLLVPNVHLFPGHIACDSASNSEIVVPLHKNGALYGVLDIDSPLTERFSRADQGGLERLAEVLEKYL